MSSQQDAGLNAGSSRATAPIIILEMILLSVPLLGYYYAYMQSHEVDCIVKEGDTAPLAFATPPQLDSDMTNGSVAIRHILMAGFGINAFALLYMIFELTGCNTRSVNTFRCWSIGNLLILIANFSFIGYATWFLTSNTGRVCAGYFLPDSSKHTTQSFYTILESHLLVLFMVVWVIYFICSIVCIRYNYSRIDRSKNYNEMEEAELTRHRG